MPSHAAACGRRPPLAATGLRRPPLAAEGRCRPQQQATEGRRLLQLPLLRTADGVMLLLMMIS